MKILVTGAAGFIGYHLSQRLLNSNHEVVGLDNINNYYHISLKIERLRKLGIEPEDIYYKRKIQSKTNERFSFVKLDLLDSEQLGDFLRAEKFDAVCNLGAQVGVRYSVENPLAYLKSNTEGFFNIIDKCAKNDVKHLVYASSSSVYGMNKDIPFSTKDSVDHPISFYAATKKANELFAHTYSHLYNLPTTGLRFFTVYGPWGRPDMAPFIFTKKILNDETITVFNNGELRRDFTYVDDITRGVEQVLLNAPKPSNPTKLTPDVSSAPYRVYNIGNNKPVEIMEFIGTIEELTGKKAQINYEPLQPGDLVETYADMSEMERDFGFKAEFDLKSGLTEFVSWYRDFHQV